MLATTIASYVGWSPSTVSSCDVAGTAHERMCAAVKSGRALRYVCTITPDRIQTQLADLDPSHALATAVSSDITKPARQAVVIAIKHDKEIMLTGPCDTSVRALSAIKAALQQRVTALCATSV